MNLQEKQAVLKTYRNFSEIKQLRSRSKLNLVCNYIIHKCIFFDENGRIYFESEETIARIMGCGVATVIRAVRILRNSGIIQRIRRFNGKKTLSNIYKLRPHMRMDSIIEELAPYLPALRNILCLSILIPVMTWLKPASEKHRPENDRLYSNTKYLNDRYRSLEAMNVDGYPTKRRETIETIEEKKTLKREVHEPLNKKRANLVNYPFLKPNGQRSADMLGLTMAGAAKIAIYSEETHDNAFKSYGTMGEAKRNAINEPIKYYSKLCNDYCRSRSIDADYSAIHKIMDKHKLPYDSEVYLPQDQRTPVEMPTSPKKTKNDAYKGNPYREVVHPWKKPSNEFEFLHAEPLDDIAEAIKMHAYTAAGLIVTVYGCLPPAESFAAKAQLKLAELVEKNEKYNLDLPKIIKEIETFIDYTLEKHKDFKHIAIITDPENAKMKAMKAVAEFVPVLLTPFYQKKDIV